MIPETPFNEFGKIARLNRNIVVTEKIDGTNASVLIGEGGLLGVGSRTRWITPQDDNHGFARYVHEHRGAFEALGPGHHYGEWWGCGIQRKYGIGEKRFSLFNTARWTPETVPAGLHVVPVLYAGVFNHAEIEFALENLHVSGSKAAPGFMKPEGIVIWHEAARQMFKVTLEKDEVPKGLVNA